MRTVLLDNFDVLRDIYSLPGVWGPEHRSVHSARADLINPTRPILSLCSCCKHTAEVGFPIAVPSQIKLPWQPAPAPGLPSGHPCDDEFCGMRHLWRNGLCSHPCFLLAMEQRESWGLVRQEYFISDNSGLNSRWGLLCGRSRIPLCIPETALCPD